MLTLLIGLVLRNVLPKDAVRRLDAGAGLGAKQVLEFGVALLGASVSFTEMLRAGPAPAWR